MLSSSKSIKDSETQRLPTIKADLLYMVWVALGKHKQLLNMSIAINPRIIEFIGFPPLVRNLYWMDMPK